MDAMYSRSDRQHQLHKVRPPKSCGLAAEWLYDYAWNDAKCEAGCRGQIVTEGLAYDEDIVDGVFGDGSPNLVTITRYEWQNPRLTEIVLHWRVRDVFGFVAWEDAPPEARAAFETYLLAGEVRAGYIFVASSRRSWS